MRLGILLVLAIAVPAVAQPILRVRARTRVDVESIRRQPIDGGRLEVTIRGRLVDADLNAGIGQGTVIVNIEGPNGVHVTAVDTQADGRFEVKPPLKPGEYSLRILGSKDDHDLYEPAPPVERVLNLQRTTPLLTLHAADEASATQTSMRIELDTADPGDDLESSTAAPQPIELLVLLLVDGKHVADAVTHAGHGTIDLPVSMLGKPGSVAQLVARFPGDPLRNPVEVTHPVKVTTPTQLTLVASSAELPWRGSLGLSGLLTDASGPVAGAAIELVVASDGRSLAGSTTDDHGRFAVKLDGGREHPGTVFVEARFGSGPRVSFRESSRSPAVAITVLAPAPHPLGFWLSPLVTALAIGGALVWRKKPWRAIAERRATAQQRKADNPTAGLTENRPRLLSTLRPANDYGLSGVVVELPSLQVVPTATVTLSAGTVVHTLPVDEAGRFAVEDLPAGPVTVEVTAPGYVAERFRRALPHRGELRAARVTLVPIRERIFATYRAVAVPLLPEPRLAETWTPRELLRHVSRRRMLVDDLDALTRLVEVAYFGPRLPDATVLAEAERLAVEVSARQGSLTA